MIITAISTAFLVFMLSGLGYHIARYRDQNQISLNDGGDKMLLRRMRAFGNFTEYAPLSLILVAMIEYFEGWAWIFALLLVIARGLHAYAFLQNRSAALHFRLRFIAMLTQFSMLILGGCTLLILLIFQ